MTAHDIAFLHTDKVHVPVFDALVTAIDPTICQRHDVRDDLLNDAREHGITPALEEAITQAMHTAADSGACVVVCTCSSIGGVAEFASVNAGAENAESGQANFESLRIDRAMADQAAQSGGHILVVAALESTLDSTRTLIQSSVDRHCSENNAVRPDIDLHVVEGAWQHFMQGDPDTYHALIADDIQRRYTGYGCVVLAQASMAPAAARCNDLPVMILSSPALGVRQAVQTLRDRAAR